MKSIFLIFAILIIYVLIASLYFTFIKILPYYFPILAFIYVISILFIEYMQNKIGVENE